MNELQSTIESTPVPLSVDLSTYRAEIDVQVDTAKSYPRQLKTVMDNCRTAVTLSRDVAESCIYAIPRAGKTLEGPSIRLAEIVASAWGNLRLGVRVVDAYTDGGKYCTVEAAVHDLETNVAIAMQKRRRTTRRDGVPFDDDMRGVTINAASSIALRDAIIRVIPRVFIDELYGLARSTALGEASDLSTRRAAAVAKFQKLGVDEARLCARLGRETIDDVTRDDLATLIGVWNRLTEDGTTTTPEVEFPAIVDEATAATGTGNEGLKKKLGIQRDATGEVEEARRP